MKLGGPITLPQSLLVSALTIAGIAGVTWAATKADIAINAKDIISLKMAHNSTSVNAYEACRGVADLKKLVDSKCEPPTRFIEVTRNEHN